MRCKVCGNDRQPEHFYATNKSKCKECIKAVARKNRLEKIDYYRQYDRMRASQLHRVAARVAYQQTPAYAESHSKATKKYLVSQPKRYTARNILNAAVRDKKVTPWPCMVCGAKAEAHHPDYDRPLDVVWLCNKHHRQAHALVANDEYQDAA